MDDFRRLFFRGLTALVPTLLTLAILIWAYTFLNDNVGVYINQALLSVCGWISPRPGSLMVDTEEDPLLYGTPINEWNDVGRRLTVEYKVIHHSVLRQRSWTVKPDYVVAAELRRDEALWAIAFAKYRLHVLGFLTAIVLVYFTGSFLASFVGRATWRTTERLLCKIPVIGAVYPYVKQVTDFVLSDRKVEFSSVVAIEYPRRGVWSIGLRTGKPLKRVQEQVADELVTIFIPSSPTPVTGYVVQLPVKEVVDLHLSIDDALRFTISAGVIEPGALPSPEVEDESRGAVAQ